MNKITLNVFAAATLLTGTAFAQSSDLRQAIRITDNEQFEKAASAFKALVAKDPANAETYFYYGENLFSAEKIDSAEVLYKKGIEVNGKNPLNHIGLAKTQRAKGKMSEAQSSMDAAFALFTEKGVKIKDELKVRTYTEAAEALLEGTPKNPAKAIEYTQKALEIDDANIPAYIVKGDALFIQDPLNATPSIEAFKKAIMLDPASPIAYSKLAYMYFRGGQNLFPKSIEYYTEAIAKDANFAPAYSGRGLTYYYSNKTEEAIKDYQKYLELNKGNISARKRYAYFLFLTAKYDEALSEINAIEKGTGTEDLNLVQMKAKTLFKKGDNAEAQKLMETYMKKQLADKITADDYEYLGRIQGRAGNDSLMSLYFEKAVRMDYKAKQGLTAEMIAYFKEKKNSCELATWYFKKYKLGSKDANDLYYAGTYGYECKKCGLADSALTEYVKIVPDFAASWLTLARAKDCPDTLATKQWVAKEAYTTYLGKLKPEEVEKNKTKVAEAYYFLARYYYLSDNKDLGMAKCWATKIVALNANEFWTKTAETFLKQKDVNAATAAAECKP